MTELARVYRSVRLVLPYALRAIWQKRMRSLIILMVISLAVASYLVFAGYLSAYRGISAARTESIPLPVDAVSIYRWPVSTDQLAASPYIREALPGGKADIYGPWGLKPVMSLPPGDIAERGIEMIEGRLPEGAGEVALAQDDPGASVGRTMSVFYLDEGRRSPAQLEVVGIYRQVEWPWDYPVVTHETLLGLVGEDFLPNMAWIQLSDAYPFSRALQEASGIDLPALTLSAETASLRAREAVGRAYGPYRTIMGLVFALAGLGVLNVILLGFLERRKFLGILKAHGFLSLDMMMLLLTEGVVLALFGALVGSGAGLTLLHVLAQRTGLALTVGPADMVLAAIAALAVALLGAYIPAGWSRQQSVLDLISAQ